MRTMLIAHIPADRGSEAVANGTIGKVMQNLAAEIHPEAAYFTVDSNGDRSAYYVFDMKSPSDMPRIAEPIFGSLGARLEFKPTMNAEDLQAGLAQLH